jgi:hypothetical protein
MYGTANNIRAFSWLDHLLAVFCIHRQPDIEMIVPETPLEYEQREVRQAVTV